jgi:DNA-binding HxlR family transcriptional regulator
MSSEIKLCPKFEHAFEILGKRWNGLILYSLMDSNLRFSQLEQIIPQLSARMLTFRLKELEDEGLIDRLVSNSHPIRVEYQLTDKGKDLKTALDQVGHWATKWDGK